MPINMMGVRPSFCMILEMRPGGRSPWADAPPAASDDWPWSLASSTVAVGTADIGRNDGEELDEVEEPERDESSRPSCGSGSGAEAELGAGTEAMAGVGGGSDENKSGPSHREKRKGLWR